MKKWLISTVFVCVSFGVWAQQTVIFNHTEYDFNTIGKSTLPFEHDFIFRNTSQETTSLLSVSSMSRALQFIYTRSDILSGEYGFVKVKLNTDSLDGIFHDEVYVTVRQGAEVWSEILYVRAHVTNDRVNDNGRQFQDSEVAISVEVSPADIESLEGFSGQSKINRAKNQITYLQKQLDLKSELIAKLSEDLRQKEASEAENIRQLQLIEESVKAGGSDEDQIIAQIERLAKRLHDIQKSDKELRNEVLVQEAEFMALKEQADSARAYAQTLSEKLQDQFRIQAASAAQTESLRMDLARQKVIEAKQQRSIDSLNQQILLNSGDADAIAEINRLKDELTWKRKEQQLQADHTQLQHKKIDKLKAERARLASLTDSLDQLLSNTKKENESLQERLAQSNDRIKEYENDIKVLKRQAERSHGNLNESDELKALRAEMAALARKDDSLSLAMKNKDQEIEALEAQTKAAKNELAQLEGATTRETSTSRDLMLQVNNLSERESKAKMEINQLKQDLAASSEREEEAKKAVRALEAAIAQKERQMAQSSSEKRRLSEEMMALRSQLEQSKRAEKSHAATTQNLTAKLENARLSNAMAFEELRGDVEKMQAQYDEMKRMVDAGIVYRINLFYSDGMLPQLPNINGYEEVSISEFRGKTGYAIGGFLSYNHAMTEKNRLVKLGYPKAEVIGYKNGVRLTTKEMGQIASLH
ncbi:MAG: hypothetical protein Salg2KO_16430 [Salibacteraceae bacterium]